MVNEIRGWRTTDGTFFTDEGEAIDYDVLYHLKNNNLRFYDCFGDEIDLSNPSNLSFGSIEFIKIPDKDSLESLYEIGWSLWCINRDRLPSCVGLFRSVRGTWMTRAEEEQAIADTWEPLENA